jgi:hypothetical protein
MNPRESSTVIHPRLPARLPTCPLKLDCERPKLGSAQTDAGRKEAEEASSSSSREKQKQAAAGAQLAFDLRNQRAGKHPSPPSRHHDRIPFRCCLSAEKEQGKLILALVRAEDDVLSVCLVA